MLWSPQQEDALREVSLWLRDKSGPQCFHLFGYAGSGKTTLARHFAESVTGLVQFGAYTGKAASVLRKKGCEGATTIHSLIYKPRDKSGAVLNQMKNELNQLTQELIQAGENVETHRRVRDLLRMIADEEKTIGKPYFTLNFDSEVKNCKLLIIDECSMIDSRMGEDLLSFGVKVLVLGDPAQLPPVKGAGFFTEGVRPNVMLEEIHRQAEESPIIRMASTVRCGKPLEIGSYGDDCEVINKRKLDPSTVTTYDQYLVGRNTTRRSYNSRMREILGHQEQTYDPLDSDSAATRYPVVGDKIVCLRNNHEEGLLNGVLFRVDEVAGVMDEKVLLTASSEDGAAKQEILTHEHYFVGRENDLSWFEKKEANEFDYGYALTVHKAQGSQWDRVFVTDESFCFRADKWKWLYTAITRAAKSITVMKT